MKRIINSILKPNKALLVLYGVLSFLCLIIYVWKCSFVWEYFFSVTFYIVGLLVTMIIGLGIARLLDEKFNWSSKRYFVVSILQLLVILTISNPVRTWQINNSMEKAQFIIEPLENYKKEFGTYPSTLTELEKNLNQKIPIRTNIGTKYSYEIGVEQDYTLWFVSYYGYMAYYNKEQNKWVFMD